MVGGGGGRGREKDWLLKKAPPLRTIGSMDEIQVGENVSDKTNWIIFFLKVQCNGFAFNGVSCTADG